MYIHTSMECVIQNCSLVGWLTCWLYLVIGGVVVCYKFLFWLKTLLCTWDSHERFFFVCWKKGDFFVQNKYITFSDMMKFLCSIMNVFMFIVSKIMRVISKYLFVKHFPKIFNRLCNLLIVRTVSGIVFQDCRPNK